MKKTLANNLGKLREEHGLSQESLAQKLGVSRQAVSKWECGDSSPDTENLVALANLYGVSLDELVGRDVLTSDTVADAAAPNGTTPNNSHATGATADGIPADTTQKSSTASDDRQVHISWKDGINVCEDDRHIHIGWDGIVVDEATVSCASNCKDGESKGAKTADNTENVNHASLEVNQEGIWINGKHYDNWEDAHKAWEHRKRPSWVARIPVVPLLFIAFLLIGICTGAWLVGLAVLSWTFAWLCFADLADTVSQHRSSKKIADHIGGLCFGLGLSSFLFSGFMWGNWWTWTYILYGLAAALVVHILAHFISEKPTS